MLGRVGTRNPAGYPNCYPAKSGTRPTLTQTFEAKTCLGHLFGGLMRQVLVPYFGAPIPVSR
eukprot:scaffold145074_cov37-Prasinocladus_malaysianus.AAC.1